MRHPEFDKRFPRGDSPGKAVVERCVIQRAWPWHTVIMSLPTDNFRAPGTVRALAQMEEGAFATDVP
ncbi:hypothetical protein Atai01_76520 [Amycolatopsis taiwanensis]|uniref:Uncharacterized protein n=1 Tax=Amycolatopsis taiwanensis TaxID=342230 RepID=A0A9W6VGP4_9PSEU|nr:hypothetical protein Atai01_76520 [Amycolatopsis taiwanensis]